MSTSSSEPRSQWAGSAFPWAGLLAVALVIALDMLAFRLPSTWAWLAKTDRYGVTRNHGRLVALAESPPAGDRVLVVGTSRSAVFDTALARKLRPDLEFDRIGRPGYTPMVVDTLLDDLIAVDPALVVWMLSESDTHHPLRLEPAEGLPVANRAVLSRVLSLTNLRYVFENRQLFLRLLVASWLDSFRFRNIISDAGLARSRKFDSGPRMQAKPPLPPAYQSHTGILRLGEAKTPARPGPLPDSVLAQFSKWQYPLLYTHLNLWVLRRPGPHVRVQFAMIRDAVARLRRAGIEVVILETPMHTAVLDYIDPICRRQFFEFATSLARDEGVEFISLEDFAPYRERDFKDLFHLNPPAGRRLTRQFVEWLDEHGHAGG